MKTKILLTVVVVIVTILGGLKVYNNIISRNMNDLLMSNVEALTSSESGSGCYQTMGYCSNATGMVRMCTSERTGENCWTWVSGCKFC